MIKRGIGLVEGNYPLKQNQFSNDKLCHVKLTETSQRALDNLIKSGATKYSKAVIKVSRINNQNILKIPTGDGRYKTFSFQIATYHEEKAKPNVIKQKRKDLFMLGNADVKMTVNATNDSFGQTYLSMKKINNKNQESSTQLLDNRKKPSGKHKNYQKSANKKLNILNKKNPPQNRSSFISSTQNSNLLSLTPSNPIKDSSNFSGRKKTAPSLVGFSNRKAVPNISSPNKDIVIHLLAVRPYKLDDLVDKLNKLQPKSNFNAQQVMSILEQVAEPVQSNSQPAEYSLLPQYYKDVSVKWLGYNEKDRQNVLHKINAEEMRVEIDKKSPKPQPQHKIKFKEEDFGTNAIQPKTRVANHQRKKSPQRDSPLRDLSDSSPAGSNQSDVQISMGLVSDDIMTPSKHVTQQKIPQKQIRTPKKAEATEHEKKNAVVTASYVAGLSVKDFSEIKDAKTYKHYNDVGAMLEKRYRELESEIGQIQEILWAMTNKYSRPKNFSSDISRASYKARIEKHVNEKKEHFTKLVNEHQKIHVKITVLLALIRRYDDTRGLEVEEEVGVEFLVRRKVKNADRCVYINQICGTDQLIKMSEKYAA